MTFLLLFILLSSSSVLMPSSGIVCRKERIAPLGFNDFRGGMNVDCGQYVQHCLKVRMWDGTIIRDCDPLALCPKDGNKMISKAEYFCCLGNLCNGSHWTRSTQTKVAAIFVPLIFAIFLLI